MSDTPSIIPSQDVEVLSIIEQLSEHEDRIPIRNLMKALWIYGPAKAKAQLREDIQSKKDRIEDLVEDVIRWAAVIRAGIGDSVRCTACP